MNASVRFGEREGEGPLLRVKAPVKVQQSRFALGISASPEAGVSARASGAVPHTRTRARWRVQVCPSLEKPKPVVALKAHTRLGLPVAIRIAGELGLSDLSARISLSCKPAVPSARPELEHSSRELVLRGHSASPTGNGSWAQARWELAFSSDPIISPSFSPDAASTPSDRRSAPRSSHLRRSASVSNTPTTAVNGGLERQTSPRVSIDDQSSMHTAGPSHHSNAALPRISRAATSVAPFPWAQARIVKLKFVKVPDRASARQVLCQDCANAPLVRQQAPAVRGGLTLEKLARAYASTKIEDAAPPLKALRRDLLTDLKAVTLAHWMLESDRGRSQMAWHHCNYARMRYRQDLAHLANPVRPEHAYAEYCSFDSAEDFIRAFWYALGREAFTQNTRALTLEPASSSDSACNAFLETLTLGGIVTRPDQVGELVPEARRLMAQNKP